MAVLKDVLKRYFKSKNCKLLLWFLLICLTMFIVGCESAVILNPKGSVGHSEKTLIITSAALMLIVVVPAIILTLLFAWQYHHSAHNHDNVVDEEDSLIIEIAIWAVPSLIVIALAILVWIYSHSLDPYRPLDSNNKPINIEVVSLDWKWLFIYPDQQIATVNEIVFPTHVPIHFYLTSDTVMNSFFIPQLGSQIMTMYGMQTQLFLIANTPGVYDGISANFSGSGFTGMTFKAIAGSENQFADWINQVKKSPHILNQNSYIELARPSTNNPVEYFSSVQPDLFMKIINGQEQIANPPVTPLAKE